MMRSLACASWNTLQPVADALAHLNSLTCVTKWLGLTSHLHPNRDAMVLTSKA